MLIKANQVITRRFYTADHETGDPVNANALPIATVKTAPISMDGLTVTVTKVGTGKYTASVTMPASLDFYEGQVVEIEITATVGTVVKTIAIPIGQCVTKIVSDLNDITTAQVNTEVDTALSDVGVTSERMARLNADISSRMASGNVTVGAINSALGFSTQMGYELQSHICNTLNNMGYTGVRAGNLDRLSAVFASVVNYLNEMIDTKTEDYARFTAIALEESPVADTSGLATDAVAQAIKTVTDAIATSLPTNFAALGINESGHISRVTLTDTTAVNTDMRGTDGAVTSLTGIATTTNISDLQTHGDGTWKTATGFSTFNSTTDEVLANIVKVDSDSDVVAKLKANLGAIELLTVAAGATTTNIPTNATNTNIDNYINRVIIILSGDNKGEVKTITAYDGSGTFTVEELTIAPAESVQVLVI